MADDDWLASDRKGMAAFVDELSQRRQQHEAGGYEGVVCANCGEAWFRLIVEDSNKPGVLAFAKDGTPTSYYGWPHCVSCNTPAVIPGMNHYG